MKEIFIKIDDELYRRASQRIPDLEADVARQVTDYLKSINGEDEALNAARIQMKTLFAQTKNFSVGLTPTRQEMHER